MANSGHASDVEHDVDGMLHSLSPSASLQTETCYPVTRIDDQEYLEVFGENTPRSNFEFNISKVNASFCAQEQSTQSTERVDVEYENDQRTTLRQAAILAIILVIIGASIAVGIVLSTSKGTKNNQANENNEFNSPPSFTYYNNCSQLPTSSES